MIGSFLTRGLVMILGYAYPAYECYKTVERNKPEIEQLRFWCQYWILLAVMTVFERIGDTFVSWVPMYCEAKLAFIIYLWYPKTKGTTFVYNSFFQPYISKRETEIDRNLLELRSRAGDMLFMYCQRTVSYGQIRIFEILQYVAAQSTPRPRPTQTEQQAPKARQAPASAATSAAALAPPPRQPSKRAEIPQPQPEAEEETLSRTSSTSSSPQENEIEMEDQQSSSQGPSTSNQVPFTSVKGPSTMAPGPPSFPRSPLKKSISMPIAPQSPRRTVTNKVETLQITTVPAKVLKPPAKSPVPPHETVMEETIRVTRGRLRKTRSTVAK